MRLPSFLRRKSTPDNEKGPEDPGFPPQPIPRRRPFPETNANILSKLVYWWLNPLMALGYRMPLESYDLYDLDRKQSAPYISEKFNASWAKELAHPTPALWRALNRVFGRQFWSAGGLLLLYFGCQIGSPLLVQEIINYVSLSYFSHLTGLAERDQREWYGYVMMATLFCVQQLSTIIYQAHFHLCMTAGYGTRAALVMAIYRKALRLSGKARQKYTQGAIVNLMSTDCSRLDIVAGFLNLIWVTPIIILVALGLLLWKLGLAALVGFAFMALYLPLQHYFAKSLGNARRQAVLLTDQRIKMTQQFLQGIKVVKLYAWEESLTKAIYAVRRLECRFIRKLMLIRGALFTCGMVLPSFATIISFIVYVAMGSSLDPGTIFASLALFNVLRTPLMLLPQLIAFYVDARVSLTRVGDYLQADELSEEFMVDQAADTAIVINGGCFVWDGPEPPRPNLLARRKSRAVFAKIRRLRKPRRGKKLPSMVPPPPDVEISSQVDGQSTQTTVRPPPTLQLMNISLSIPRGCLVGVVGAVGSGKSSLLNTLVGEMRCVSGTVAFGGSISYCAQTAWIQNATVRDNILFGQPYNEERYERVLKVCALEKDLMMLPQGDQTEIGERGISLSGGQKQRLNIARAVYFDASIILMDDPLSAVDSHVGKFLFERCILEELAGKTRVLVTHQLHFIPQVDYVIYLDEGRIVEQGTYEALMESGSEFAQLMAEYGGANQADTQADLEAPPKLQVRLAETQSPTAPLMKAEERSTGAVSWPMYKAYFFACGGWLAIISVLFFVVGGQAFKVVTDSWLTIWIANPYGRDHYFYGGIYFMWGVVQTIFGLGLAATSAHFIMKGSLALHDQALQKVAYSPMSFFDTTPLGRIINRFSKDVDGVDNLLLDAWRSFFNQFFGLLACFILIIVSFPLFLAPLAPMMAFYVWFAAYYRSTSRELKRLDSISRSPLYAHFQETLSGLATVRAYGEQDRFIQANKDLLEANNRAYYLTIVIQRWLAVRLETISNILVLFAALFAILARRSINPSIVGLVLTYSLQTSGLLSVCVRQAAEVENNMNAVERLEHYIENLDQEAPAVVADHTPPPEWPMKGVIEMKYLVLRYRPELPPVLRNVTFGTNVQEKIGIVGRTGAGKSSIMLALFRLVEPTSGSITIDGISIRELGLRDLRSRLAIIPQDPVLFEGTIRSNLDPDGSHSDADIWAALERAELKPWTSLQPQQLDTPLDSDGESLSAGQKQLMCLARALLKRARVVILDEATASVDLLTDNILQRVIRDDFRECTVLTIAHRLNTVIDYDRILVIDAGMVKEFDTPRNLLSDSSSQFYSMVQETGPVNAALLMSAVLANPMVPAPED
ncbi:ABC transporter [Dimargaris cristalligena]|uniref:ABC transporter n=1 Tax=Dimargaris cristalligena TaxID=215637 RepID=A0A4P9ZW46_9FUNG|nr:ABC transporter [Dimargaris cristalligena]|eukprot:RKP37855.1 ABC transporter [Dimargaris cristalligena]